MSYTEEIKEAVRSNADYLGTIDPNEVAFFLECVAESLYESDLLIEVAEALRDVSDGA